MGSGGGGGFLVTLFLIKVYLIGAQREEADSTLVCCLVKPVMSSVASRDSLCL